MSDWVRSQISTQRKKALPILSFPAVSLLGVSVKDLICDPHLQAQGMKLVAQHTDSAATVSFMDLSVEAECFGASISVSDTEVPTVSGKLLSESTDVESLHVPEVGCARSRLYIKAIEIATREIRDRPVFAGMIGPFSLAARLMDVSEIMINCYDEPEMVHLTLEKATRFLIQYALAFKNAGANGIMIAEPVAGLLSPTLESEFSSPYMKQIVDELQDDSFIVIYHNCGGNTPLMCESLLSFGAAAYHFGNAIDMQDILDKFPTDVLVMGNIDPAAVLRMGSTAEVKQATIDLLNKCSKYPNFVISSGCDMPPMTPWDNIHAFFNAVNEFYEK